MGFQETCQKAFKMVAFAIAALVPVYVVMCIFCYRALHAMKPEGYELPEFGKVFWLPFASALVLWLFKLQLRNISRPLLLLVVKDKHDSKAKSERAERAAEALYKNIYYTGCAIVGFLIMKDSEILPPSLGGSGSFENIYRGFPY